MSVAGFDEEEASWKDRRAGHVRNPQPTASQKRGRQVHIKERNSFSNQWAGKWTFPQSPKENATGLMSSVKDPE